VQLTPLVPGAAVGESFDSKNEGLFAGVDFSFSGSPSVDNQGPWTERAIVTSARSGPF
jgi:hypothetical protein